MTRILYPELSYVITGLCFKTQKELGRFCREKQYADSFKKLLVEGCLAYRREYDICEPHNLSLTGNRVDFFIEDIILVELKAKRFITKEDYFQMQRYLHAADLDLGLIVNFRSPFLKPKRVLNVKKYKDSYHSDA